MVGETQIQKGFLRRRFIPAVAGIAIGSALYGSVVYTHTVNTTRDELLDSYGPAKSATGNRLHHCVANGEAKIAGHARLRTTFGDPFALIADGIAGLSGEDGVLRIYDGFAKVSDYEAKLIVLDHCTSIATREFLAENARKAELEKRSAPVNMFRTEPDTDNTRRNTAQPWIPVQK